GVLLVADGPAGLRGRVAGHGDDRDDLLGAEGGGTAGPGRVGEGGFDQREQGGVGGALGRGGGPAGGGLEPAVTPEADAEAGEPLVGGDPLQTGVVGQREQDRGAAYEPDGGGLAAAEVCQRGPLPRRESDARGT